MELLIVGAGTMGRWVADAVDASIAFADADAEAAQSAAAALGGRAVDLQTDQRFDAVCIAVPISAAERAIEAHAAKAERAVLDVTGAMTEPVAAMAEHAPECERMSLHPLFAPDNAPGNVAVVADEPGPVTDEIRDQLDENGNDLFETTPAEHDEAMETVQARTHAAVLSFALAAESVPDGYTTPIYDELAALAKQVTNGNYRVYSEIQSRFDGADDVAAAAEQIADADPEAFEQLYRRASENQ